MLNAGGALAARQAVHASQSLRAVLCKVLSALHAHPTAITCVEGHARPCTPAALWSPPPSPHLKWHAAVASIRRSIDGDMHLAVQDLEETKREAAQVVELLDLRQGGLTQTLDGGFPELRNSVWQSEVSVQSAVQVLPQPLLHSPCDSASEHMRQAACQSHALTHRRQGDMEALSAMPCTNPQGR